MAHPHPAKFSEPIINEIAHTLIKFLPGGGLVLDPFAGVGGIHQLRALGYTTTGVELEPEWAGAHPDTICGNSLHLVDIFADEQPFDAIITSPTYANRMADHHEAKDDSVRNTYRHVLGRPLSEGSTAGEQWGERYKGLHAKVWDQTPSLLVPGGLFVLNISNHIRKGEVIDVTRWHMDYLLSLGYQEVETKRIQTRRQKHGANAHLRVDYESLITFRYEGHI